MPVPADQHQYAWPHFLNYLRLVLFYVMNYIRTLVRKANWIFNFCMHFLKIL